MSVPDTLLTVKDSAPATSATEKTKPPSVFSFVILELILELLDGPIRIYNFSSPCFAFFDCMWCEGCLLPQTFIIARAISSGVLGFFYYYLFIY